VTDRIELRGLRVLGICGVLPEERERPQPLEIDLDVEVDLSTAGASDALADTVDYGAVARAAARVAEEERFALLERLAERIAESVGAVAGVEAVTVAVRKLRPPVALQLASAGVRVTRRRTAERPQAGRPQVERRRAFLGLGSNLGDRWAALRAAVAGIPDVVAVSPVYETEPVGGPPGQPTYLNAVVQLDTPLSPRELLELAHRLEAAAGRERDPRGERNAPRTLDVDVLLVGDLVVDEPDLAVPHPRMGERRFVLQPLSDLAPDAVPDGWAARGVGSVRAVGTL
jgi:dihydroneopterin aldolase/2-amino-4-hydroxy-6-hydroxymethyldihydropteridine diphosphokinase